MKHFICIHAHFYQPPREDPWRGEVEKEISAFPFHDWNERITIECYRPNYAARILDATGHVLKELNNYSLISFDFGPTLLTWLERKAPDVYREILSADKLSRGKFSGHGSAIAQAYHHPILPLANRRDKETEVIWGIKDFEFRFGRKPEGIWLPETAVDLETLEILAEQGIRFTILAPHQAKNFPNIDTTRPYQLRLPSEKILSIFFYDGEISKSVAFERLLDSGDQLFQRLTHPFPKQAEGDSLVHIATDGESYGHHHKFGEMALAYVLDRIQSDQNVSLTNYGEFLQFLRKYPPVEKVGIRENSSWSCIHGIERWRSDCGCHVGGKSGWNQRWRAPLRAALDWLRDQIIPLFEKEGSRYLHDPWSARNDYVELVYDPSPRALQQFFDRHAKGGLSEVEQKIVLSLLELQRYALRMYTSCGWFFSDISGLESRLVLKQAGRILDLARHMFKLDLLEDFLKRLEEGKSNLPEFLDGRKIFDQFIRKSLWP